MADFQFDGFVAQIDIAFALPRQVGYGLAVLVVAAGDITGRSIGMAAQQFIDGQIGRLALDVPQGDVHRRQGRQNLRPAKTGRRPADAVAQPEHFVPQGFVVPRIAAQQHRLEQVDHGAGGAVGINGAVGILPVNAGEALAGAVGFADAVVAGVGMDARQQLADPADGPQRRPEFPLRRRPDQGDGFHIGDFHCGLLPLGRCG